MNEIFFEKNWALQRLQENEMEMKFLELSGRRITTLHKNDVSSDDE